MNSPSPSPSPSLRRRSLLAGGCALLAGAASAQPRAAAAAARPIVVAQFIDVSPAAQDITRDFLVGARAAWQDANVQGGVRGRPVQHLVLEVDAGQPQTVQAAWRQLREHPDCVAVSGTASDPLATQLVRLMRADPGALAHVAPWLQSGGGEVDAHTFPIFAGRQEQIAHALKALSVMGVQEVGAVFASAREHGLYHEDVAQTTRALRLRLASYRGDGELARLGQRLGPTTPALLLFIGGTPELVQFAQGLGRQARQRYVLALADVNLQTVQQLGVGLATPIIATQAVPMVNAALPVVRRYREVLAGLYDEPASPLSLAGFLAARYTWEVLREMPGPLTREGALAAFQRRADLDLGGYRIRFDAARRSAAFVTQSMLTPDGRVVG